METLQQNSRNARHWHARWQIYFFLVERCACIADARQPKTPSLSSHASRQSLQEGPNIFFWQKRARPSVIDWLTELCSMVVLISLILLPHLIQ